MSHLTEEETCMYKDLFRQLDTDSDGSLNKEELGRLCEALGYRLAPSRLGELFKRLDTDNDDQISIDEFLATMPNIPPKERNIANLRRLFLCLDKDRNGVLSAEELSKALSSGGMRICKEKIDQLIAEVDINGDGQLNYEEFLILAERLS